MDRLLAKRQSDVEDWSDDFSLNFTQTKTYNTFPELEVNMTGDDDKDNEGFDDDEDEDWDKELVNTNEDTKCQRDESNSFFRTILATVDSNDSDTTRYTMPESYKLVSNAMNCFGTNSHNHRASFMPQATPLLTLDLDGFPIYAEKKFEEWLCQIIPNKEESALQLEKEWSMNFEADLPEIMTREVFLHFSQMLSYCIRRNLTVEAINLVGAFEARLKRPFFDPTKNQSDEFESNDAWLYARGGWSVEILQMSAEICKPPHHRALFSRLVKQLVHIFPIWFYSIALIECRYVGHHWKYFQSNVYTWQCSIYSNSQLPKSIRTEVESGLMLIDQMHSLFQVLLDEEKKCRACTPDDVSADLGLLSLSSNPLSLQVLLVCDIQNLVDRKSTLNQAVIPHIFSDEHSLSSECSDPNDSHFDLFHPDMAFQRMEFLEALYVKLTVPNDVFVKARCAHALSRLMLPHTEMWSLCESLAMEALRLLDIGYPLSFPRTEGQRHGLLSPFGREALETLGSVLAIRKKYRYAIAAYEAAQHVYCFQYLTRRGYEKLDRLCSGLCLNEGDLDRALQYHDRVLQWTKEHENCNEFVYIMQMINSILLQKSQFRLAEQRMHEALIALRDPNAILPSAYDKSTPRRFYFKFHANTYDGWFLHDIQLHLCLHEIFKASGRVQDALYILQHLLSYEPRFKLPRGKRVLLTMMVAEDALKLRQLELCISMLRTIEHDIMIESESSTYESKSAWEVMCSFRYLNCRARCYYYKGQHHRCALWLSVALAKGVTTRQRADVYALTARCLLELHLRMLHEIDDTISPIQRSSSGRWCFNTHEPSLSLLLNKKEQEAFQALMEEHWNTRAYGDACAIYCWKAFDVYGTLNDAVQQLKNMLVLSHLNLAIMDNHRVLDSSSTDLKSLLKQASTSVQQALKLAAESAVPLKMIQALVFTAKVQYWCIQLDSSHDAIEFTTTLDEACSLLFTVYLHKVEGSNDTMHVVPLLPFPPGILVQLERIVSQLLVLTARISCMELGRPHRISWIEMESAFHHLNKCTYWYSTLPARSVHMDDAAPVHPRTSQVKLQRQQNHQKQLSLSSISDMMAFSMFRRTDSFSCDTQEVCLSPFAYVEPIKPSTSSRSLASPQPRSRSQSAPASSEVGEQSNFEWDEFDLEVEVDGIDFWRACNQEYRKQQMIQLSSTLYTDNDGLWGIWYSYHLSQKKYKTGRLTPSAFRLASLRLIYDIQQQSNQSRPSSSAPPMTDGMRDSYGVMIQDWNHLDVILHRPNSDGVEMHSFPFTSLYSWYYGLLSIPFMSIGVTNEAIERVLNCLGSKVLIKTLSCILLETPLIVVHTSMSVVQEILLVLVHLLRPFVWHFLLLPALPMTSTSTFVDLIHAFTEGKTKRKVDAPPPFLAGISLEMWRECTYRLTSNLSCASYISVLQIDTSGTCKFQKATNRSCTVLMQARFRRHVVDAVALDTSSGALKRALKEVYQGLLKSLHRTPSFKQWFRLESQEFTKLFQATTIYQTYLKDHASDGSAMV